MHHAAEMYLDTRHPVHCTSAVWHVQRSLTCFTSLSEVLHCLDVTYLVELLCISTRCACIFHFILRLQAAYKKLATAGPWLLPRALAAAASLDQRGRRVVFSCGGIGRGGGGGAGHAHRLHWDGCCPRGRRQTTEVKRGKISEKEKAKARTDGEWFLW